MEFSLVEHYYFSVSPPDPWETDVQVNYFIRIEA
jgi:hypothetical protein